MFVMDKVISVMCFVVILWFYYFDLYWFGFVDVMQCWVVYVFYQWWWYGVGVWCYGVYEVEYVGCVVVFEFQCGGVVVVVIFFVYYVGG